jgi:hypothetical protein
LTERIGDADTVRRQEGSTEERVALAYLNCPECYYRVRSELARTLDGEMSCPRCARKKRFVAMYSTALALNPHRGVDVLDGTDPARPERIHSPRVV